MYVLIAFATYSAHRNIGDNGFWLTLLIGVFGVLCGWMIGALSSPADAGESKAFTKYAGIISAFLSGYLLTKIDVAIVEFSHNLLSNPVYGLRLIIFLSCLISGVLIMYILRSYLDRETRITEQAGSEEESESGNRVR